jgi:DNA modification methylase
MLQEYEVSRGNSKDEIQGKLPWEGDSTVEQARGVRVRKRANQLDGKTWLRYSISIWNDIRKTAEEEALRHPAIFPTQLITRLIKCYTTDEDKVILDPFVGVGSTVVAAHRLGKIGIGIDIEPNFVEKGLRRLGGVFDETGRVTQDTGSTIHCDDAKNLLKNVSPQSVDMVITSPPYWDILMQKRTADYKKIRHYGEVEADLGKIHDYEEFLKEVKSVFGLVYKVLKDGKYCCVVVMDLRKKDKFYPYHSDVARFMQEIGFIFDDIIVWDRRHEYSNLRPLGYPSRFRINKAHEYILIFQKPARGV